MEGIKKKWFESIKVADRETLKAIRAHGERVIAVDPARPGVDETVIAEFKYWKEKGLVSLERILTAKSKDR